ncbi:DUF3108 domain-containing protein [bacterium]|nr:DUF3108 domain-containing protein [bacterium]MBU3955628.1 DUF3108 domain-containing protein [bacterium]
MRNLRSLFLFSLFICVLPLHGADSAKLPFGDREELVYNVHWSFISVGEAVLGLERISTSSWRVYSTANSYPFFNSFYKVRDIIESVWDLDAQRSLRFEKHLREGKKNREELIVIDTAANMAVSKGDKWDVTPFALDVLSALHFIRMKPLTVGKKIVMDVYTNKKLWPLEVEVIKKQKIKVGGKKYNTILVEPKMREEGIFSAKGRIWVWLTDDKKRIPVRMSSKVLIGSVSVDLIEIRK